MIAGSLGRRYARALLDLGTADGNHERVGREVRALADTLESSKELSDALANPAFPRSEREKILVAVLGRLGASDTVSKLARLLLGRERISALPDIARELDRMIDEKIGRVKAIITSAKPLTPPQERELVGALERLSGKRVEAEKRQDPELLGGAVAQLGDVIYDGSLRTQLQRLRTELTK